MIPLSAFKLISRPMGNLPCCVIQHSSGAELEVLTGFGAGLNAWRIPGPGGKHRELLAGYHSEDDLHGRHADTSAGVRLSPFPNRLKGGQWKWNGLSGELPINFKWQPHAIHGLLHTVPWSFASFSSDEKNAELVLERSWQGEHPGFPFAFTARTRFFWSVDSLTVQSETVNDGKIAMPYGEGWHPYFSLGAPVDELEMRTPALHSVLVDDLSIPTGERQTFGDFTQGATIGDRFIDNCWAVAEDHEQVETVLRHKSQNLSLKIWQKNGPGQFRYIQAYTPPDRQSIAIEPMTCEPDAFNHHRDLLVIAPGQKVELQWGARFTQG